MGIANRDGALYLATGIDNTGMYSGRREALGIIKAMAGEITSFDIFGGIGISAAAAFAKAAKDAYTFEKDFQKSMYEVASISGTIKGSLTDYMNGIMDMTRQIPVAANESAKALYQIVSAGHDGADAMNILEVSAKAAIGGVTDTATAADAITTVLNSYKMSASEAGIVSDQLFMTAKLGKTTMGELGQSIAQVAPIAASYGVEIDQVLAAVASLTKQGTPTAQAMTQIRASIVGVSKVLGDGAFDSRTFQEALAEVAERSGGSESQLRTLIPEIEAVNGVLGLTGNNAKAAASDLNDLGDSLGASEDAFKTMQESADNQLQLLQNNIIATLRPLGEGILKEVSEVAQKMNDAFSNGDMENSLQTLETLIKLVSVAFVAYKANAIGAAVATSVQATATKLLNNVKSAYNTVSGAGLIAKEKERVSQLAYIASLEKTLNAEQRAKLSKMGLKSGTKEYAAAITELKEKEKDAADKQVSALGKETSAAEKSMVVAKERAVSSSALVEARKRELAALTSTVQAEKIATAQKELSSAMDKQRSARENAISLNRQKIAAQQAVIAAKESGQSAAKVAALEREIRSINKKVIAAKAEYTTTTQAVAATQAEIASINRGVTSKQIETATKKLNTAIEKENTASTAANAAMKDFYSKKSATAIASTKAGTIATALSSAQQRANAAATSFSATAHNFLAAAKMKAALATKALTVAIAANPIGALLTVVSLAASAIMMFGKEMGDTVTVQERFNKSLEEQKRQLDELKSKTEEYLEIIRSETSTQYDKEKALDSLQKMMPSIFKNMDIEKLKLMDELSLRKQIAEEINRRERIGAQTNLIMATNKYNTAAAEHKRKTDMGLAATNALSEKNDAFLEMELAQKQYDKILNIQKKAEESLKPKELKIVSLQSNIDTLKAEIAEMQLLVDKEKEETGGWSPTSAILDTKKGQLSSKEKEMAKLSPNKTGKTETKAKIQNEAYWTKQKNDAETELKALSDIEASGRKGAELKKKITEYQRKIDIFSPNTSKQETQADKLRQDQEKYKLLMDKQARDQKHMELDSQHELEQIEINGLVEGSEKVLRQRKLNHDKELEAIKREAQDKKLKAIEEARAAHESNPDKKKDVFDADKFAKSEPAKKQFASFDKVAEEKTKTTETKYNRGDDLAGLLSEYQDYTDKRLAIETKFNNDIATLEEQRKLALKNGDTQQVEEIDRAKAQATAGKGKELMGLDYDKLKESPEYVRAFENLKETSSETLNSLLSQLENAKGAAAKVLSPDQLREYTTTIQEIMDELDARNPFQSLSDKKQELADAEQELADAQMALENARQTAEAVKGGAKIESGVKSSKFNQKTGKIDSTKAYLSEAQALEKVKDKTDTYNDAKDKVVKKSAQVKKAEKNVTDQIDELSKAISDVGKSIGGPAGEIISLIGDIGSFAMMAMSGVKAAADTSANAISTVEKASVILAIISAAVQIATKIFDMFGKDDTTEKYEDAKEVYESYINILDQVIEKHLELAETLSGENANAAYQKAIDTINLQSENAKILGKQYLNSGASRKNHSKGYNEVDDMSWEGWNQAAQALGMTIDDFKNKMGGRMSGLFDLTDEQLATLQTDAGIFWSQLDSDTQNYANQVADGVARIAEVMEQRITDTTLIDVDSLRSDFQDLLTDMDASSADFADNFEGYMKDAIINSMIKDEYMDDLKAWREKLYNAMDDGVTEEEYDDLKDEGKRISDEMKAKQEAMKEMYGWTGEEDSEREASKKGIATASQDSVDENNGRLAVMQDHTYNINENLKELTNFGRVIMADCSHLPRLEDIGDNLRTLTASQDIVISHLSNIENNTARLATIEETMYFIKTGIDTLNTKGITLKR